ncbi:MAG: hypothetical protein J6Q11_01660 [Fibrobacteraceae bacterium]|nr:hypothetical protein [Fibrobacteraceae bacterium]
MNCSGARPFSLATIGESEPIRAKVANTLVMELAKWFSLLVRYLLLL